MDRLAVGAWLWDRVGDELTFALSSLYALIGFWLVARWVTQADVREGAVLRAEKI